MSSITVVNKLHTDSPYEYIGRGSPLGNPYGFVNNGRTSKADYLVKDREEAVRAYEQWFRDKLNDKDVVVVTEVERLLTLAQTSDLNLGCYCKKENKEVACHGDVIKRYLEYRLRSIPKVTHVGGDIVELFNSGYFDIICHGCNCFTVMSSGLALQIKKQYKQVHHADQATIKGDRSKLGTIVPVTVERGDLKPGIIINMYTQFFYGRSKDRVYIDYGAFRKCMGALNYLYAGSTIGIPKIGCGLGGGDWEHVSRIIEEELKDVNYIFVYK